MKSTIIETLSMLVSFTIAGYFITKRKSTSDKSEVDFIRYEEILTLPDSKSAESHPVTQVMSTYKLSNSAQTESSKEPPQLKLSYQTGDINYKRPTIDLLIENTNSMINDTSATRQLFKNKIVAKLSEHGIHVSDVQCIESPSVWTFKIRLGTGVTVAKVESRSADIGLALGGLPTRLVQIQGEDRLGIEVPNTNKMVLSAKVALSSKEYSNSKHTLPLFIGKDTKNQNVVIDLARMPHLLIAGTTGSGKSIALNTFIVSLLFKKNPDELKFILIDPKKVEFSLFKGISEHFLLNYTNTSNPIVKSPQIANEALLRLTEVMENRLDLIEAKGCKNIAEYNAQKGIKKMYYIVAVIDELAELMATQEDKGKALEHNLCRLAQLARAVGIHLIVATQRPSVNVITGTIKANFPVRISFKLASLMDSRTILDAAGAENLTGSGDCILSIDGAMTRLQAPYLDSIEINNIVQHIEKQDKPTKDDSETYTPAFLVQETVIDEYISDSTSILETQKNKVSNDEFEKAKAICIKHQKCNISFLKRELSIGDLKAKRLMDLLEQELNFQ